MEAANPEPALVRCAEQPTAVVRELVAIGALPEFSGRAYATVAAEAARQDVHWPVRPSPSYGR